MKKTRFLLLAIASIACALRLYHIQSPIADWHSWRQADTSAVTRNFLKKGFTPLTPRYDDISNIQTGHENPEGYRFVEFPVYNVISYMVVSLMSIMGLMSLMSLEVVQRIVAIAASLVSLILIYKITARFATKTAGLFAALFFGVLPYSVYYSRVILPEPLMVCLALSSLYSFVLWHDTKRMRYLIAAGVFGGLAVLAKPFALFFFPPLLYFLFDKRRLTTNIIFPYSLYGLMVIVPFILWRMWMAQFPEGIPAYEWLLNHNNIRFKGAFFYWLIAERLGKLILGYIGMFFLVLGILSVKKNQLFFHLFGLSIVLYVTIFAGGNVQHDYYQILLVPIVVMYLGLGVDFIVKNVPVLWPMVKAYGVVGMTALAMVFFSWYHIREYYWINKPVIVEAGRTADRMLPADAKVIAPLSGDTAFLYHVNRQGWPQGLEIEKKIALGATHYVSVTPEDAEVVWLKQLYPILYEGDGFVILQFQ